MNHNKMKKRAILNAHKKKQLMKIALVKMCLQMAGQAAQINHIKSQPVCHSFEPGGQVYSYRGRGGGKTAAAANLAWLNTIADHPAILVARDGQAAPVIMKAVAVADGMISLALGLQDVVNDWSLLGRPFCTDQDGLIKKSRKGHHRKTKNIFNPYFLLSHCHKMKKRKAKRLIFNSYNL